MNYRLVNIVVNPIVKPILRSPFRSLLPSYWALLTYTGRKTHKKHSLPVRVAQYGDEFIAVPGCFGDLPAAWWRNFRKESMVDLLYRGKLMECFARVIKDDETAAAPRITAYLRNFPSALGITAETTEEMFNKSVTMAAKTYSIVAIRPRSSASGS
jgi:hypothetical protein